MRGIFKALGIILLMLFSFGTIESYLSDDASVQKPGTATGSLAKLGKSLNDFADDLDKQAATALTAKSLAVNVTLSNANYIRGNFAFRASFTVNNVSTAPVKDIEVTCRHFGQSGTEIDSNTRTIYQIFMPGSTRINDFNMGFVRDQTVVTSCQVTSASPGPRQGQD